MSNYDALLVQRLDARTFYSNGKKLFWTCRCLKPSILHQSILEVRGTKSFPKLVQALEHHFPISGPSSDTVSERQAFDVYLVRL